MLLIVVCAHFPELLETLSKNGMSAGSKHNKKDDNLRHRSVNGDATKKSDDYTTEQLEAVKK